MQLGDLEFWTKFLQIFLNFTSSDHNSVLLKPLKQSVKLRSTQMIRDMRPTNRKLLYEALVDIIGHLYCFITLLWSLTALLSVNFH